MTPDLKDEKYRTVGGIYCLNPVAYTGDGLEYRYQFVLNEDAICPLPPAVVEGFVRGNENLQGPPWQRE